MRGIGEKRERSLWRHGVTCWEDVPSADLSWLGRPAEIVKLESQRSLDMYRRCECAFFAGILPPAERWRIWPDFRRECCYIDVETDPYELTLVGVYRDGKYERFIRGQNLAEIPAFLDGVKLIASYCGSGFDLPVLRRHFGDGLLKKAAHVDVMHVLHGMGIKGGLKASEERLGITRPSCVKGFGGEDAVRLWREYRGGSRRALELLIAYNREDAANLERILDTVVPRLIRARLGA